MEGSRHDGSPTDGTQRESGAVDAGDICSESGIPERIPDEVEAVVDELNETELRELIRCDRPTDPE
jgi:hypothetical protein